jgi:DNA polymerase III epsilon subunit-like protein
MDYEVVYDTYVKPDNEITNYLTKYSGVTPEHMANCTTRLADVQNVLLGQEDGPDGLIAEDTILLGHSLDNDMHALKIVHHRVIDTAILDPHPAGPPMKSALRFLANRYLKKSIQGFISNRPTVVVTDDKGNVPVGHDSVVDASICMELLVLKLKYGPSFGHDQTKSQNVLQVIAEMRGYSVTCIDRAQALKHYAPLSANAVAVGSDSAAVAGGVAALKKEPKAVINVALHSLYDFARTHNAVPTLDPEPTAAAATEPPTVELLPRPVLPPQSPAVDAGDCPAAAEPPGDSDVASAAPCADPAETKEPESAELHSEEIRNILRDFDSAVDTLYAAAPRNTIFIVLSGQGSGAEDVDKTNKEAVDAIRRGLAWVFVKTEEQEKAH